MFFGNGEILLVYEDDIIIFVIAIIILICGVKQIKIRTMMDVLL